MISLRGLPPQLRGEIVARGKPAPGTQKLQDLWNSARPHTTESYLVEENNLKKKRQLLVFGSTSTNLNRAQAGRCLASHAVVFRGSRNRRVIRLP